MLFGLLMFWLGLLVATGIGLVYFRDLGDVSQMLLKVKRDDTIRVIRNENRFLQVGAAATALMIAAYVGLDAGPDWAFWTGLALIAFLYLFTYIWVHVGLRNQVNSAQYYSIDEARKFVNPSSTVLVLENNGVARAHPDYELLRPHLAGNDEGLGGENVVMTYCAMANLGVGYTPEVAGQAVDLEVLAQHGNNLILRDNITREPIQQIYGRRESDGQSGPSMKPWPTFRMTLRAFEKAYPDGQVFLNKPPANPLLRIFDFITDNAFSYGITRQHREEKPLMDNMTHFDDRLPNKTYVWGINIGDDAVCYTQDFVVEQSNLVNTTIGGKRIVVTWDPAYESLGAFYNESESPVTEIDFFGNSDQGLLPRVEHLKPGLFWHVWVEFFQNTDINRVG